MNQEQEATKTVINRISDELHEKWTNIKWDLPNSVGKKDVILEGVEIHAQLQLIYRIIHEIHSNKLLLQIDHSLLRINHLKKLF